MIEEEYDNNKCLKPCRPDMVCEYCEAYWDRMKQAGYWKDGVGWTEKGFIEFTK